MPADRLASVVSTNLPERVSDAALARRARLGDADAFSELFARHFPPTFRYALHMLDGDEQLAQDAAQDAWIKAWRNLPDFRGESRLQTWIFRILARQVFDIRRRNRPLLIDDTLLEPAAADTGATDPEQRMVDLELWEALSLALAELPWRQRASWLLREFEDMSYDEIAKVLDTTPTVVRGQLHRARRALAIRMEHWR
ncbi:MAG: RNA polymerase sigma factor [Nocardioides sp.]